MTGSETVGVASLLPLTARISAANHDWIDIFDESNFKAFGMNG